MNGATLSAFSDVAPRRRSAIYIFAYEEFSRESSLRPTFHGRIESNICTDLQHGTQGIGHALRRIKAGSARSG